MAEEAEDGDVEKPWFGGGPHARSPRGLAAQRRRTAASSGAARRRCCLAWRRKAWPLTRIDPAPKPAVRRVDPRRAPPTGRTARRTDRRPRSSTRVERVAPRYERARRASSRRRAELGLPRRESPPSTSHGHRPAPTTTVVAPASGADGGDCSRFDEGRRCAESRGEHAHLLYGR